MTAIATPGYARNRTCATDGNEETMGRIIGWLRAGIPQCHVRFCDGEFFSILGRTGPNADGQEHLPLTLGKELKDTLKSIAALQMPNVLVGGHWGRPWEAWPWIIEEGLEDTVPWCTPQVWTDAVADGSLMTCLTAIRNHPGRRWLVANKVVAKVAPQLRAEHVLVQCPETKLRENLTGAKPCYRYEKTYAYDDMLRVKSFLQERVRNGDIVIWCAGLGCKPTLWDLWVDNPLVTHLDMGCTFDGAAGLKSRSWFESDLSDHVVYKDYYAPRLKGEKEWPE